MSSSLPDDLAQAVARLRARRLGEARALLTDHLRREPRSDHAWFLLSLTVEEPRRQRDCLQRALQLNLEHAYAREQLAELDDQPSAPSAAPAVPPAVPPVLVSAPPATPRKSVV